MSIDLTDWRIQFTSTVAGTSNPVFIDASGRWKNGSEISIVMPSPSALMLNAAFSAYSRASILRDKIVAPEPGKTVDTTADMFDYIQAYLESIIHSFTSLEITCNVHIHASDELVITSHKSTETFQGEQIERWVHLDKKIEFVATKLGATIDKSQASWGRYKRLADMRDRIIHLKNSDRESHSPDDDNIWSFALATQTLHPCDVALEMLTALYANKESPPWLGKAVALHNSLHTA